MRGHSSSGLKLLKIITGEEMIGGKGFARRSGTAQVKTPNSYQPEMKIMIDCDEFIERKVLSKVPYRKNGVKG